jgi:hypothetical protein
MSIKGDIDTSAERELPTWFWLLPAPLFIGLQLITRYFFPEFEQSYMTDEHGVIENLTVVILIPAIALSAYIVLNRRLLPASWMWIWYGMLGLACLYFAGEEASWGQHYFGWATPDEFKKLNDQGETNLHNMSSWLDQKPRLLVEISAIVGGVILPLVRRFRGKEFAKGSWQSFFWPTWVCLPVALVIALIKLPDRIFGGHDIPFPFNIRVSETQELYVALGFAIYLASVAVRMKKSQK